MSIEKNLEQYAEHNLNVLLIGTHGIGKTTIVKQLAKKLNLVFKYFSSSTLDPWAELVGIPVPDKERKSVDFYRPEELEKAEFIFFDELNRADPKVLDSVLEVIQFKTINGVPLPNLKMVWAAINPPQDDYQVEDLDPVLVDRFHAYVKMQARISLKYMKEKMSEEVARACKDWWEDLNAAQKKVLTPRRLEYVGMMIDKDLNWHDALPQGHTFNKRGLEAKVEMYRSGEEVFVLSKENIILHKDKLYERLQKDKREMPLIQEAMRQFNSDQIFECRDIVELFPTELLNNLVHLKWTTERTKVMNLFISAGIDGDYPKTMKAFASTKASTP